MTACPTLKSQTFHLIKLLCRSHEILVGFYGYVIEIENLETFRFYHMNFSVISHAIDHGVRQIECTQISGLRL